MTKSLVAAAGFGVALAASLATGKPTPVDPNLMFWVQMSRRQDTAMLADLVQHDSRIHPIIITRVPSVFGGCPDPDPDFPDRHLNFTTRRACADYAACDVFDQVRQVFSNMSPPLDGFPVTIMVQLFGAGGRRRDNADQLNNYFPAPALCRPPLLNLTNCPPSNNSSPTSDFPGAPGILNNDYIGDRPGVPQFFVPYWTPWFNFGPNDCSDWFRDFATQYSANVAVLPGGALAYHPKRIVMDLEDDTSPVFLQDSQAMQSSLINDPRAADPNFGRVKGVVNNGSFHENDGPMISDLLPPNPAPECDGCAANDV